MTSSAPQQLDWPDCVNVRDLGGAPTRDGGRIRSNALIRSDNLDRLTEAGVTAVRQAGVRKIVDLRSSWECDTAPSPFADDSIWCNMPLEEVGVLDHATSTPGAGGHYVAMLDRSPDLFASAVAAIADAPDGCVLVNCHAGKDRTGIVIALVLSLAGVTREAIVADYMVTQEQVDEAFAGRLAQVVDPVERAHLDNLLAIRSDAIDGMLDHLDDQYGGVAAYLAKGGLTADQIDRLVVRLRDEPTATPTPALAPRFG